MDATYERQLEKNIGKYSWFKLFNKRIYLPLITIQLVTQGGVTVTQLAIIAAAATVVQIALQMPSGYVADRWGNRRAIVLGSLISVVSVPFYIVMPNFVGGLIANVLFFGGYAFQSGALEAFMHDTLIALGKEKDYARVMGRAQSFGLAGNAILIASVPATYAINHNLPFIFGFFSLIAMLWLSTNFTYPPHKFDGEVKSPVAAVKAIVNTKNVVLFIIAGFMTGVSYRGSEFRELLFQDIGIKVALFGMLLALGSIAGAVMGRYLHVLDRLKPLTFYFFDLCFLAGCLIVVGATRHPLMAIAGFTLFIGYTRVRLIVFQSKLLFNTRHAYKASLLSALTLFSLLGELGAITLLARFIGFKGYVTGHLLFGISVFAIGLMLWFVALLESRRPAPQGA